jgi:hypothetical protein
VSISESSCCHNVQWRRLRTIGNVAGGCANGARCDDDDGDDGGGNGAVWGGVGGGGSRSGPRSTVPCPRLPHFLGLPLN